MPIPNILRRVSTQMIMSCDTILSFITFLVGIKFQCSENIQEDGPIVMSMESIKDFVDFPVHKLASDGFPHQFGPIKKIRSNMRYK